MILHRILKIIYYSLFNPSFAPRYIKKFILKKLLPKPSCVKKNIGEIRFEADFSSFPKGKELSCYLQEMALGVYEIETILYLKRVLKPGDIFVDVGANVGYISAIAANLVGKRGQIHSFEPVPAYFSYLQKLVSLNPKYNIIVNNFAAGEFSGKTEAEIAASPYVGAHSLVPGFLQAQEVPVTQKIEVAIMRLDDYINKKQLDRVALIKIDAELYDFQVLMGLQRYLDNGQRPIIICEMYPLKWYQKFYGHDGGPIIEYMRSYGYDVYNIYAPQKKIQFPLKEGQNVIFRASN